MRFSTLSATVTSATLGAMALRVSLTYDTIYDEGKRSLSEVACWNPNVPGLFREANDWLVQENVAPGILAMPTITGWDDGDCLSCWEVRWEEGERSRVLLAVDGSQKGFVTSLERMNSLTNGQAEDFQSVGPLEVSATRVGLENCGFAPGDIGKVRSDEL
ncbi:protein Snodprot1 [Colletotrichum liriopes]|uniref:protein SnodProt1 n=1 Tax=Colletotrichum liriopes TaxID=708192 RepID=A0AA37GHY2_9PEZI|nr:protein SnodProt1 [Colletotrichum liriopes]GJC86447.1 protein Snodprot1 [Colletotrichum liriopes]GJC90596.1 protein Snodprot1 [Colletotrichum liriopes]